MPFNLLICYRRLETLTYNCFSEPSKMNLRFLLFAFVLTSNFECVEILLIIIINPFLNQSNSYDFSISNSSEIYKYQHRLNKLIHPPLRGCEKTLRFAKNNGVFDI